jgi:hypothetical protein
MTSDRRAPWWYSGDDDEPMPAVPEPEARDIVEPEADDASDAEDPPATMDWTALVAGAARMVDWAAERVMAPHAEHTDPSEHPECMVCRTVTLIGDPVGLMGGGQSPPEDGGPVGADAESPITGPDATTGAQPIRWIPIVETSD